MHKHKLRSLAARAAAVGAVAFSAALIVGSGAGASVPNDPPGGATPVPPHFYNGNVEGIRDTGSDTTIFMMQKIGDLYTGAGLYGCTLNGSAGQTLYNSSDPASATSNEEFYCQSGQNQSTTDVNDNWDRTEVTEGVDDVGSGAGQNQLCGALSTPLPVDFARSSKPAGSACSTMVETGYAKDAVEVVDYPIDANDSFGVAKEAPYNAINGGVIGDLTSGWLPGDPTSCTAAGTCTGTGLTDMDNTGSVDSVAYRLWCVQGGTGAAAQITDWGALTNLGPSLRVVNASLSSTSSTVTTPHALPINYSNPTSPVAGVTVGDAVSGTGIPSGDTVASVGTSSFTLAHDPTSSGTSDLTITIPNTLPVGDGMAVGVPVELMGVNTASGTEATYTSFAQSGTSNTGCSSNMDLNAMTDPNPATATGDNSGQHIGLENNSAQMAQYAATDEANDPASMAAEVNSMLYIEARGVFNTDPYAAAATIGGQTFSGNVLEANGVSATVPNMLSNKYPLARTLFNIYNSATIRASTGGFLNWICDSGVNFPKNVDNSTGSNFDTELTTIINGQFGFVRLSDTSEPPAGFIPTPGDNLPSPDNSCAATLPVTTTSGSSTITLTSGAKFPVDIVNAGGLQSSSFGQNVVISNSNFPAGTTVVSGAGTSTLTLSASATQSGTGVATVFYGVPSVTSVANSQS